MNFQQPRKSRPRRILPSVVIVSVVLCTIFIFFKIQLRQQIIGNLQDSIKSTNLLKEDTSSHEENVDNVEVDTSSTSTLEDKKPHDQNVDDVIEIDNSSSIQEDKKYLEENEIVAEVGNSSSLEEMEEDAGFTQQTTSPNWPDATADELFKKVYTKKSRPKNKESDRYRHQKPNRKVERKRGNHDKNRAPDRNNRGEEFPDALVADVQDRGNCDIFSGEWVPNPEAPYYTNVTCIHIQEHQNCMKFGKPNKGYTKWKWKPDNECDLPLFRPHKFLEQLRGKSLAFVGDSVSRNHMQSLLCLLSTVVLPVDVSINKDENFKRFKFSDYNFTISIYWAPYLVRTERTDPDDVTRPFKLFLDESDEYWPTQVKSCDYIIISAGQWFFRPTMFYINGKLVGCLYCPDKNVTHLSSDFSYRRALRTAFNAINSLKDFKGVTFFRTFATSHFQGGPWDKGGDCVETKPFKRNETTMEDYSLAIYKIQLEELKIAQKLGAKRGHKFRLFDATRPMFLRPDGHPSKYGHESKQKVQLANDCVHWCLPGPIDTLNDFLQELITREFDRT